MAYMRNFISFICETDGYGYKSRRPSGSCILETRGHEGKISCFAQDLKPETLYTVYLIFKDGERYAGMPCGALPVDKVGKAQQRFSFDADKILDGAFKMDDCIGVAVMVTRAAELTAPLCGYKNGSCSWRKGFYDGTVKVGLKPETADPQPLQPDETNTAPQRIRATISPKATMPDENFQRTALEFKNELNKLKQDAPPNPMLEEKLAPFFGKYKEVTPFKRQNRAAKWVKIAPGDTPPAPINAPDIFLEPFVRDACGRDGHMLIGITEGPGRKQYIIGIPEQYDPSFRVKANLMGFSQFKPCEDVRVTKGQQGYWLMFVNM